VNAPSLSTRPRRDDDVDLLTQLHDHAALLAALREEVAELRSLLGRAQRETVRRIDELMDVAHRVAPIAPSVTGDPMPCTAYEVPEAPEAFGGERPVARAAPVGDAEYRRVVMRIRTLVRTVVPPGSILAVVSRGDHALVDLDGRDGWHFPRGGDGRYAGHHPKDSAAAIAHVEELCSQGARFLLVPVTAAWWLEYYEGFRRYLEQRGRVVVDRDDTCIIFALDSQPVPR